MIYKNFYKEGTSMIVSTKGRYALRVMLALADEKTCNFVPLKVIAQKEDISLKYLESILVILSRAGFVDALRGRGGGYRLAKSPGEYTVGSILQLTESTMASVSCPECVEGACDRSRACKTLPLWRGLDKIVSEYLDGVTLENLMDPAFFKSDD